MNKKKKKSFQYKEFAAFVKFLPTSSSTVAFSNLIPPPQQTHKDNVSTQEGPYRWLQSSAFPEHKTSDWLNGGVEVVGLQSHLERADLRDCPLNYITAFQQAFELRTRSSPSPLSSFTAPKWNVQICPFWELGTPPALLLLFAYRFLDLNPDNWSPKILSNIDC